MITYNLYLHYGGKSELGTVHKGRHGLRKANKDFVKTVLKLYY